MSGPHLVALTGAGISAESGLKTFRDSDGLWEGYDVYTVASPEGWKRDPQLVLDFYNARRRDVLRVQPNAAHYGLAELEKNFHVSIITQNIDDLHERAGSRHVIHLHGEITKMRSSNNDQLLYPYEQDIQLGDMAEDGGQLRPHVVWFGEAVPEIETAAEVMGEADILAIIGTSLNVYPAAGLVSFLKPGTPVYVIDKKIPPTPAALDVYPIEANATQGIKRLKGLLQKNYRGE